MVIFRWQMGDLPSVNLAGAFILDKCGRRDQRAFAGKKGNERIQEIRAAISSDKMVGRQAMIF
ncbi:MAG: hypothetical protein GWP10_20540 [Nitrospiraceae bacterium]|nr:hypothetical protein [Nitrospiraceae bacterium]